MTFTGLAVLVPLILVALTAVVALLVVAFYRDHKTVWGLTLAGLALAFMSLPMVATIPSRQATPLLILDDYALFFVGLIIAASFVIAAFSRGYLERLGERCEEYYVLLLCATLGAAVLAASTHFASFFLGLEVLSVSLYGMIAYSRSRPQSIEAAVKYLVLAAGSAAFLLFGMALIYSELGTMEFARIVAWHTGLGGDPNSLVLLAGSVLMIVGIGFKLALVPFHLWTPDVYQGAPAPVTAFIATASKGAVFALLLRYFTLVDVHASHSLIVAFTVIAVASMTFGNFLALLQNNVKRILAYSSIANLGYLLVAFLASGPLAVTAAAFFLAAYFVTGLGAFAVIAFSEGEGVGRDRDADSIDDYRGLFWRRPWLAGVFTAMLLSLAGIPITGGFIGKFYLLAAGEQSARWGLVFALVFNSAVGLFYYLRVVIAMCAPIPAESAATETAPRPLSSTEHAVLAGLTAALVWLGVYPGPFIHLLQTVFH